MGMTSMLALMSCLVADAQSDPGPDSIEAEYSAALANEELGSDGVSLAEGMYRGIQYRL